MPESGSVQQLLHSSSKSWWPIQSMNDIINIDPTDLNIVARYKDMVEMYDWIIMPVVNPDGYQYSHTEVNINVVVGSDQNIATY